MSRPDTVVCRCEDVRYGELAAMAWQGEPGRTKRSTEHSAEHSTWTDAKLQTRCGMGPCQGRICGPMLETLFGVRNESVRPPLFPLPMAALACELSADNDFNTDQTDLQETR